MAKVAMPIRSIDLFNGEIKEYPSISKAARENGTENINIRRALYGKWTHHLGYRWEFINKG